MADEPAWHSLTEAAQLTGLGREAIRSKARRGLIPSRKGNRGELAVQIPAELLAAPDQGVTGPLAALMTEIGDLRAELARAEAERDAQVEAARDTATARVNLGKLEIAAVRELADRLTAELVAARAELAEARRPWLARVLAALRRG